MAAFSTLLQFQFADGEQPVGSLVEDAAGNLFGTALGTDTSGKPREQVFEVAKAGSGYASAPTILATLDDNSFQASGLSLDAKGDVFFQTHDADGVSTDIWEIAGGSAAVEIAHVAGALTPNLSFDPSGNLYAATVTGDDVTVYELKATASGFASVADVAATFSALPTPPSQPSTPQTLDPGLAELMPDPSGRILLQLYSDGTSSDDNGSLYQQYVSIVQLQGATASTLFQTEVDYANINMEDDSFSSTAHFTYDASGNLYYVSSSIWHDGYSDNLNIYGGNSGGSIASLNGDVAYLAVDGRGDVFGVGDAYSGQRTFFEDVLGANGYYTLQSLAALPADTDGILVNSQGVVFVLTSGDGTGQGTILRVDTEPLPSPSISKVSVAGAGQATISGAIDVADAGLTISLYDNGALVGAASADASGAWTSGPVHLAVGQNVIEAVATNSAGGVGSASATVYYGAQWATTTGVGGPVFVVDAEVNVIQGGATVYLSGRGDAVSLYNATNTADTVYGDDATVIVNGSLASIHGGADAIYLGAQAGSVHLYDTGGLWDVAYGDGASLQLSHAQVSVVGSDDVVFFDGSPDNAVSFYGAAGWESVYGDYGAITLNAAEAAISGKGERVYFTAGSQASLYATAGVADAVYGSAGVVCLTSAQASVTGGYNTFYIAGQDDALDLYATNGQWDTLRGNGGAVTLHGAQLSVVGGGDRIAFAPGAGDAVSLYATNTYWDTVTGSGGSVILSGAQASIVGGANAVYFAAGANNAVSLYDTYGATDRVYGSGGAVYLTYAQAEIHGDDNQIAMSGFSAATVSGAGERFAFQDAIGRETIAGFALSDTLTFSAQDFANFATLSQHIAQSGADTLIRYDAADYVTLTGVQAKTLTAANFNFV